MYQSIYYIEKNTNTFDDNLAAFGLAFVLNAIANDQSGHRSEIYLEDWEDVFAVKCEPAIQQEWVESCKFFNGAPLLITYDKKLQKKIIKGASISVSEVQESNDIAVDYEDEKRKNEIYFAWLKDLPAKERGQIIRQEATEGISGPTAPHPDWNLFRAINPPSLQGYNGLIAEWRQYREIFPELLKIVLSMTATQPNRVTEAEESISTLYKQQKWGKPKAASASQLLNPIQGKGMNSPKMAWRTPGQMDGFWLIEWLKLVGLRYGGLTRQISGVKDRKTYVLTPKRLSWNHHMAILGKFQPSMSGSASAIKLDVLASLRYTQAILEHYEEARVEDLEETLFGKRASDLVSGMQTAFYKDLGNAVATMNIASLNLPTWVKPTNPETLVQLQIALNEHLTIVRLLDEKRGNQYELLGNYRDFLSGNDFTQFFAFTNAYSSFVMQQYERGQYVRPFTTTTLEVLFMNSDDTNKGFASIIQDQGFQNVAEAIRRSTVLPQMLKGGKKKIKPVIDIRYGLGQQLVRKAAYPQEFLAELAQFLHLYNAENAQLREKGRSPFRDNVTTVDIAAITTLVDKFGSKLICNMLVAYGYASIPRESKTDDEPTLLLDNELSDTDTTDDEGEE